MPKKFVSGKDLIKRLDPKTQKLLKEIPEDKWFEGYKQMKESEKRRLEYLRQTLSKKK